MPKTPPKGTSEGPTLQSTPQSQGTASAAAHNNNERACATGNIKLVNIDLAGAKVVEFVPMLKALLARRLLGVSANEKDTADLDKVKSDANQLFDEMFKAAINFCNSSLPASEETSPQSKSGLAPDMVKYSTRMKDALKRCFETKIEKKRYDPITSVINYIMLAYEKHRFGKLPMPESSGRKQIIVIPNDPVVIESEQIKLDFPDLPHLPHLLTMKRTPDLITILLSYLHKLDHEVEDFKYEEWVISVDSESEKWKQKWKDAARRGGDGKTSWLDILSTWELKVHSVVKCAELDERMSETKVLGGTSSTPASNILHQASGSSTGAASSRSSAKKRSHAEAVGSEYASELTSSQKKPKTTDVNECLTPDMQCAYYAIERLRAAWNVTHSIVLLLDDNMLSIQWYDAEGCIMTQSVNIIRQLPLFVVLVIILQRFDAPMWGLPDIQTSQTTENGRFSFELDKAKRSHSQLAGRRTFGAGAWPSEADDAKITPDGTDTNGGAGISPVLDGSEQSIAPQGLHDTPITASTPPPMIRRIRACRQPKTSSTVPHQGSRASPGLTRGPPSLFFKAAWPENSRDREPDIIAKAISRVNQYLDDKFKPYVLEHIPTVVCSEEVGHTSTGIIRLLLGLSTQRSCTLLWMVCHKLVPIVDLGKQPDEEGLDTFWKTFWELIRCHYLLWRIGIAHGDISFKNLMYNAVTAKAVVNDFDLAAIMEPGGTSPQKRGFERMGTKPFMALELLWKAQGEVKRKYRHDLESFAWCLLWCAMAEPFPDKAIHGSLRDVYDSKSGFTVALRTMTAKSGFQSIWQCVVEWVHTCRMLTEKFMAMEGELALNDPVRQVLRSKDEDEDRNSLKVLIALVDEHGPKIPLDDPQLDWVEFEVPRQASSPGI
ncbi:hypothetical protein EDD85DRAFT_962350 [Armillaria nabsnona]|nr:hypothetical protein EDD85DRAFT_962350 [Armillaria nabsnona]